MLTVYPFHALVRPAMLAVAMSAAFRAGMTPVFAADSTWVVASGSMKMIGLDAGKDDTTLLLEGRLVTKAEGGVEHAIQLRLNDTLLTGDLLVKNERIYEPENMKPGWWGPSGRYSPVAESFAFQKDNDYILGNGPFLTEEVYSRVAGYTPTLQLRVGPLLKPGRSELLITNASNYPFEIRRLKLLKTPEEEPPIAPFPLPSWTVMTNMPDLRRVYEQGLQDGQWTGASKAQIESSLALPKFLNGPGERDAAMKLWRDALSVHEAYPARTETAYRLAAERFRTGQWMDATTSAEVRDAVAPGQPESPNVHAGFQGFNSEAWADLTRGLLSLIDAKPDAGGRLIIRPELVNEPIKVDGLLDEPAWKRATAYPLIDPVQPTGVLGPYGTTARFIVTPDGLGAAFSGEIPEHTSWTAGLDRDSAVWDDNAIEFMISPDTDLRTYYELNSSVLGTQFDSQNGWWWRTNPYWNGTWQERARLGEDRHFDVEYLVPWSDLGLEGKPAPGSVFIITAIRSVVENRGDDRLQRFFAITKHREIDNHRMMDGAVLVIP